MKWGYYGFIREDENQRVYLKPPGYFEGMIYDFSVSVGDTIKALNIYLNSDTLNFVVTQVDSVLLLIDYRKRIKLYEYINQKEEVWVEGLGSYFGILNSCNDSYGVFVVDMNHCVTKKQENLFISILIILHVIMLRPWETIVISK